jgi:hypothetical protein
MVATRRTSRRIQNQNGDDTDASVEFIEISDAELSTPMKTPRRATRSTTSTPVKQSTAVSVSYQDFFSYLYGQVLINFL